MKHTIALIFCCLANVSVQQVPYPAMREKLEAAKQIVQPEEWKRAPAPKKTLPKKTAAFKALGN